MKKIQVDWNRVELLTLRSFTGSQLSDTEMTYLQLAYYSDPDEYTTRTRAVREEERKRIQSL